MKHEQQAYVDIKPLQNKSAGQDQNREYYAAARQEMVPYLPTDYSRVLEVGCGEGVFTTLLTRPCETWGVELNAAAGAVAATRMSRVLHGQYEQVAAQVPDRYFDLVVCNDVIEHLAEPEQFLVSIREKMAPHGCLIASIPNIRHWEVLFELLVKKDWRYRQSGILDRTHLRFFTKTSLVRMFKNSGFDIDRLDGINDSSKWIRRLPFVLLSIATAGYYADIQYRQFAVRARLASA